MSEPKVVFEVTEDGVGEVTLNRPEVHNAMDDEVIELLTDIFRDLGSRADVHLVTLTGRGESFSAGGDLNWMRRAADYTYERNMDDAVALGTLFRTLSELPKPTIALVNGPAYAGGTGLITACDIAVGVKACVFAITEVTLGLIAGTISPHVVRAIGARNARRYFLTAERFDAAKAEAMGLLHEVVEDHEALQAARDRLVKQLRRGGPRALAETKKLIAYVDSKDVDSGMVLGTARFIAEARASDEGKDGTSAFLEKRKPFWVKA